MAVMKERKVRRALVLHSKEQVVGVVSLADIRAAGPESAD
jgi:CBS domain-containing protein